MAFLSIFKQFMFSLDISWLSPLIFSHSLWEVTLMIMFSSTGNIKLTFETRITFWRNNKFVFTMISGEATKLLGQIDTN